MNDSISTSIALGQQSRRTFEAFRRTATQFFLADIDMAMAMLDHAETTRQPEVAVRSRRNARAAHDAIARFLRKVELCSEQYEAVAKRLVALRARLDG